MVPVAQGTGIVQANVLQMQHRQVGVAAGQFPDQAHRRQRTAREDITLDKVDAATRLLIALVAHGDGLQQHQPVRFEQRGAGLEVGGKVFVTDRLDHLDRNEFVVLTLQLAVVLEQQGNAVLQAGIADTLLGMVELLLRQRGGRYPAAIVLGGVDCHAAPAGADFQQVIVWAQLQLAADPIQLVELGVVQIVAVRREDCRRVHHAVVQQAREQLVAKIVVGADVAA